MTGALTRYAPTAKSLLALPPAEVRMQRLHPGALVLAGTVLGRLGGEPHGPAPHLRFTIQPASAAAPLIDPAPVLDGWRLRERTSLYRGRAPHPSIGQALLMDPASLARLVLADRRITIYACGRADIANGQIDSRVLGALELLADAGLRPSVSRLACGHPAGAGGAAYAGRRRGRHLDAESDPGPRTPGRRLGHRPRDSPAARAPGADEAEPDREPAVVPRRR